MALAAQDVFVNIVGGIRVDKPAADLAVALAAASHRYDAPVDAATLAVGEVGLAGEVRAVSHIEKRVREAARLGFEKDSAQHEKQGELASARPARPADRRRGHGGAGH